MNPEISHEISHEMNPNLSYRLCEYLEHIADEYVEVMNGASLELYGKYLSDLTFEQASEVNSIVAATWSKILGRAFAK